MSKKEIMENKAFTLLVEKMDLIPPKLYDVRVDEYEVSDKGIMIVRATVLNDDGSDNRPANLQKLAPHLKDVNLIFR